MLEFWVLLILPAAVAFAAAMDIFTMTIPNRVSILMTVAFFPAAWLAGIGWGAIAQHAMTGVAVLAFGFVLFARGLFGGGDAKLLAAIALWLGYDDLLPYLLWVAVAGGMLAIMIGMARQVPLPRQLLGASPASRRQWHSLRRGAGCRRAHDLPRHHVVRHARELTRAETAAVVPLQLVSI